MMKPRELQRKMISLRKLAEVSKKWFSLRDSYGVAKYPGQDEVLILAVAVCIDEMSHEGR